MAMTAIERSLPIIMATVADGANLSLQYGHGSTACCDDKIINIPLLPEGDAARILGPGYIKHEVGHVKFTDFDLWGKKGRNKPFLKNIWNILEDIYVESRMYQLSTGYERDLKSMVAFMVKEGEFEAPSPKWDEAQRVQGYALYGLRAEVLGQDSLLPFANAAKALMDQAIPGLSGKLGPILAKVRAAQSTADTWAITQEVARLLKKEAQQPQQPQPGQQGQPQQQQQQGGQGQQNQGGQGQQDQGDDAQKPQDQSSQGQQGQGDESGGDQSQNGQKSETDPGQGGSEDDGQKDGGDADDQAASDGKPGDRDQQDGQEGDDSSSDDGQGSSKGKGQDQGEGGESSSGDGDQANGASPSDTDGGDQGQSGSSSGGQDQGQASSSGNQAGGDGQYDPARAKAIQDALSSQSTVNSVGEALEKALERMGQSPAASAGGGAMASEAPPVTRGTVRVDANKVATVTSALRSRFQGLLQASKMERPQARRTGTRIDARRISRLAVGDTRVFRRNEEKKEVNTSVHLLVDCSSSMEWGREQIAWESSLAMAMALQTVKGVTLDVTAFPYGGNGLLVMPVLRAGERIDPRRFSVGANGGTPMKEALWAVARVSALHRRNTRRVIIVVTDGEPHDKPTTAGVIRLMVESGYEVYGVGIQTMKVQDLFPRHVVIQDVNQLPGVLIGLLKDALIDNQR